MKPTRGLIPLSWMQTWSRLPRERRSAWVSLFVLSALLGVLIVYERFTAPAEKPIELHPHPEPPATEVSEPLARPALHVPEAAEPAQAATPQALLMPIRSPASRGYVQVWAPTFGDWRWHQGVDFKAPPGTPVMAAAAGEVVAIETDVLDGTAIRIDHGNGLVTRYAGLRAPVVRMNAKVTPGQVIAQVGEPGAAEAEIGPHLHFEVWNRGELVDPTEYLR